MNIWRLINKYPFTAGLQLVIWVLCLMPIPETPLSDVNMIDKWTHLVMFGTLGLVALTEYAHKKNTFPQPGKVFLIAFVMPTLTGGLLELLQRYCTFGVRSGEWLDFVADSLGAFIAFCIGGLAVRWWKG